MTPPPAIGDRIQWTVRGQSQFAEPPAILRLSSDGRYCFVEGTKTGLPIDQITVVERRPPTADDIAAWLRLVVEPGSVVEFRALNCVDNPKYPPFTAAGWFDHDHLDELAKAAMEWTGKAEGCYVTVNPVRPDLLARAANRVIWKPKNTTTDADIVRRVGLVFDADPVRPAGISATEEEKALARELIDRLVSDLTARGWPAPILADSGNGFHARYKIDLAADDEGLVERVLKAVAALFSGDRIKIDASLSNPSRIIKLYGTMSRKGDDIPDRPHRWTRVLSIPPDFQVVPMGSLEALAAEVGTPPTPEAPSPNGSGNCDPWRMTIRDGPSPEARARAYVFAPGFPDSIAGQGGHDRLYHVASVLVDGFGLTFDQALPIFQDWNRDKAQPPESDKQVRHKLNDAVKDHPVPSLKLLNANRSNGTGKGTPTGPPHWPPLRFSEPPRALPFPVDVFPLPLQRFCHELAEATLAPLDFVGLSMLVTTGAAIGQSLNILVKKGWPESPLLFGIIVAQPGKTKSPVVRAVVKPLTEIDRRLREESRLAREQWQEAKKAHDKKPDSNPPPGPEPPQLRAIVKDITRESLVIILADNPRGVLCDPDEASGWVASFNEYKGKGGSDRQFWLSVWGSAPVSVDRKGGRESTYVPFPFVSVLGGLPPDMLTSLRDERGRNDGFLDRIIFSYPDSFPPQRWTERELSPEAESDWSEAIGRLYALAMRSEADRPPRPHLVTFTPEAKPVWIDWFNDHAAEMEDPGFSGRHAGVWSKLRAHAARFALILSRLRLACDPCPPTIGKAGIIVRDSALSTEPPVNAADVLGAIKLVDYFKSHLTRIGHQMTAGIGNADAKALVDWIKRHRKTMFRVAEVRADLRRFRDEPADLATAVDALKAVGAIRPRPEPPEPGKTGPKPSPAYDVHPDLLGAPEITANTAITPSKA